MTKNTAKKKIMEYIEKCNYTWSFDEIMKQYGKYLRKEYISYTANDVINNCKKYFEILLVD